MTPTDIDWSQLVPETYQYDRATETIASANQLQDGMRVLSNDREDLESLKMRMDPTILKWALRRNRWFRISNIHFFSDQMAYTATFDDGSVESCMTPTYLSWIVKKDSLPETDESKKEKVREAIKNALLQQDSATYHCNQDDAPKVDDIVAQIYKILGLEN